MRLDGGNADVGTVISPYYDSLLVKVTSWDRTFAAVCRKSARAINEVRVRGVKTNIPFVTNILAHPAFINGQCHTKFIDETPELFDIDRLPRPRDPRAEVHRRDSGGRAQRRAPPVRHPPLPRGEAAARPRA